MDLVLIAGILYVALYLVPRCIYLGCSAKKKRPAKEARPPSCGPSSPGPYSTPNRSVPPSEAGTDYSRAPGTTSGPGSVASSYEPDDVHRLVTMRCKVPDGLLPGQPLLWQSPSGKIVSMTVPDGSDPGRSSSSRCPQRC